MIAGVTGALAAFFCGVILARAWRSKIRLRRLPHWLEKHYGPHELLSVGIHVIERNYGNCR